MAGALWMGLAGLCFVGVNVGVKLVGPEMPAAQSSFLRFLFGLLFILPVLPRLARNLPQGRNLLDFLLRGGLHTVAVLCWFYAMARLPLAEVTAMGYLNPILVTLMAPFLLGEVLRWRRIFAILVAIAGAMIVLRPGFRELDPGHIAMLVTASFFALSYMVAKRLAERNSADIVVAMMTITVAIGLLPFAIAVWQPFTLMQALLLFLVALFATAGHYAMTRAFAAAPISVVQPVTALQLLWSILIGSFFFQEPTDIFVLIGGALIVGAVVFIALREAALAQRPAKPAAAGLRP